MHAIAAALFLLSAAQTETDGLAEFERGNDYFEAGEYELALPYFQKAYDLSGHRPSTIRALAQCERALQKYDEAIAHFHEYLETDPEEADQIMKTLDLLEEARRKKNEALVTKPLEAPPPPAAPPPPPPPPVVVETPKEEESSGTGWTILWISLGVAAAIGGGIAIGFAASGEKEPYGGSTDTILGR